MAQNSLSQMIDNLELQTEVKLKVRNIRRRLLRWFRSNARTFHWRSTDDAYVVLLSEIFLKKTTAQVVERFLPSFLLLYPDVHLLARAKPEALKKLLQPLGLSSQRGHQLAALSKVIQKEHNCDVPADSESLLNLPGVGEYTANSVLCVAFGKALPVVDTNVARILTRVFDFRPSRVEARRSPEVWDIAQALVGRHGAEAKKINWALLDLGAAVCKARQPDCPDCPLLRLCRSGQALTQRSSK